MPDNYLIRQSKSFATGLHHDSFDFILSVNIMPSLVPATVTTMQQLSQWFQTSADAKIWGGPDFQYPCSQDVFEQQAKWQEIPSWGLVDDFGALLGFGQFYLRNQRCHLARLVVSPNKRGQGLGKMLVNALLAQGMLQLGCNEASLFVFRHNQGAYSLYKKLGFTVDMTGPEHTLYPDIDYLIYRQAE